MQNQETSNQQNTLWPVVDPFEKVFDFTCRLCGILYLKEAEWQADILCGKCYQSEEDKFKLNLWRE